MAQAVIGLSKDQITAATAVPAFRLGTVGGYDDPTNGYQEFIYGRADGAVTGAGYLCVEETGFDFIMATTTTTAPGASGPGTRAGAAQAVMAAAYAAIAAVQEVAATPGATANSSWAVVADLCGTCGLPPRRCMCI